MPTLIDSLVIELGIDPTKLTEGQRQAMDALRKLQEQGDTSGKAAEAQGKKIVDFFSTLKREALGFAAGMMGGRAIAEVIQNVSNMDATIGRLSRNIGMSTEDISSWVNAVKRMGGDGGEALTTLTTITTELQKFRLGMGDINGPFATAMTKIGGLFQDGKLKDAGMILLQISEAFRSMPREEAFAWLQAIPGMTQGIANLVQMGPERLKSTLDAMKEIGGTTKESAAAAEKYQSDIADLSTAFFNLSRTILGPVLPALTAIFSVIEKGIKILEGAPQWFINFVTGNTSKQTQQQAAEIGISGYSEYGWQLPNPGQTTPRTLNFPPAGKQSGAFGSPAEREAYYRAGAIRRGVDPELVMMLVKKEGFYKYSGDQGTSFGDFQLHYKNNIPGLSNPGLGDAFTQQTGLNAANPSTWREQADFALDQLVANGTGAWHGLNGTRYGNLRPSDFVNRNSGGSTNTTTVSVQNLTVNSAAHDAAGIAGDIKGELERQSFVGKSMYGQW